MKLLELSKGLLKRFSYLPKKLNEGLTNSKRFFESQTVLKKLAN